MIEATKHVWFVLRAERYISFLLYIQLSLH